MGCGVRLTGTTVLLLSPPEGRLRHEGHKFKSSLLNLARLFCQGNSKRGLGLAVVYLPGLREALNSIFGAGLEGRVCVDMLNVHWEILRSQYNMCRTHVFIWTPRLQEA